MEILDKVFIWLSMCELDFCTLYNLFFSYKEPSKLWELDKYEGEITNNLTSQEFKDLMSVRHTGLVDRVVADLDKQTQIKYICMTDPDYPAKLRELDYPPFVLFYVGDLSLINGRNLGIVGSRVCTRYGREQTERFAREIGKCGFNIVSGLSEGIDTVAHETALKNNTKTIAILPNGLRMIYPVLNTNLARDIVRAGGLVLTEFYPDFEPMNYAFARRNRVIAGICEGILVTEARRESGSLTTVNFALDMNREIFALPGNCNSTSSGGTNDLIKYFGSICVTDPQEVVNKLNDDIIYREVINQNQRPISRVDKVVNLRDDELAVYESIQNEDTHLDQIAKNLNFNTKKLLGLLTLMEIRGLIKKLPGNFYARKEQ